MQGRDDGLVEGPEQHGHIILERVAPHPVETELMLQRDKLGTGAGESPSRLRIALRIALVDLPAHLPWISVVRAGIGDRRDAGCDPRARPAHGIQQVAREGRDSILAWRKCAY